MARKRGLDRAQVVEGAMRVLEREGAGGLTLAAVAAELGVRPPSLYAHVEGLAGLHREVALASAARMGEALAHARRGLRAGPALEAVAREYRAFALAHPGLYALAQPSVRPGSDDPLYVALGRAVFPLFEALAEVGVPSALRAHHARGIRAALHGFAELERGGGFGPPRSVDESFDRLVALLRAGVEASAPWGGRVD